ncbi:dual specificity protein phosphatase 19-like [Centruroides vittatus]|uniref:dual specificity protein phosphatase 19-like n=1 Tax=Centruroides vittatus TaxID=120091 RepID=UPI00350F465A
MNRDLFSDIRNFGRGRLRRSETRVTTEDGQVWTEKQVGSEFCAEFKGHTWGYVIDEKPDLQVAVVLPGLILASQDVAQDLNILKSNNITHILNLAYGQPNQFCSYFTYKKLNVRDDPEENIKQYFEECFNFIDSGLQNGCTLVHCNAGVSRAATIVIGYLMSRQKMTLKEAYQCVKNARSSIKPNNGFMKQLKEYETELYSNVLKN